MVIIYGQPVEYNYVLMKSFMFSSCVSYCYEMTTCAAVYSLADSDTCIVFEFGQISSLEKFDGTSEKIMGVKMLSANNSDCSGSVDGNSIKAITVSTCISQNDSTTSCKSTYGGVICGLQTLEERDFVVSVGTPLISLQSTYNTFGFWVNGKRKELCKETNISAMGRM
ncbi:hypothetical protein CRE_28248 [Caenorhabditis remanei]|uniref:PAN-3 domain-containing protein n=1 Tax=Caenorhabditis remanei TaxID=31234 RepID=E3LLR3_CAERE|nr:hypothetical protein CRE_28248 [Caenorhabditis remanei]